MAGTIGDQYQAKLKEVFNKYKNEFKQAFDALENAAKKLNLSDEYENIWENSTNPVNDLRKWAREHGLSKEYEDAMSKLTEKVRAELSKAYSGVWDNDTVNKMRTAGEKLKKAYKLIMRGDYEGAAAAVGIDVDRINGKPAREAMSIIASELGIGDEYSGIIGKRSGKKLKLRAELETTTRRK